MNVPRFEAVVIFRKQGAFVQVYLSPELSFRTRRKILLLLIGISEIQNKKNYPNVDNILDTFDVQNS